MKISIVTDGNKDLGMGHVYQSVTLAKYLRDKDEFHPEIIFLTKSDENVSLLIRASGFEVCTKSCDDAIFEHLKDNNSDRIIFDKLDVSLDLARNIKEKLRARLFIFTNLTEANAFADVTVLADFGSNFKNIVNRNEKTGQISFFGPKYWILRKEFYDYKKNVLHGNNSIKKILLMFGGSDPSNLTSLVLEELLRMENNYFIKVIIGSAFEYHQELYSVLEKSKMSKSEVEILKNVENVAEIMISCDLVFVSPGLSFFEALAVGVPVIGFHQNHLQKDAYINQLPTFDKTEIYKVSDIISGRSFVFPESPLIRSLEIGIGKEEIIAEIFK